MNFSIPIYVHSHQSEFEVRPLFFDGPVERAERLSRAMARLEGSLRKRLEDLGTQPRQDELARWSFCPEVEEHLLSLDLRLRRRVARVRLLVVLLRVLEQRVVYLPAWDGLWFDLGEGEALAARTEEVASRWFRDRLRDDGDDVVRPEAFSVAGNAWVSTLDLGVQPPRVHRFEAANPLLALLGGPPPLAGHIEIWRVGRCLDRLYPDDLESCVLRERDLQMLTHALHRPDRRPVALLGEARVGKTALIHEYVRHRVEARGGQHHPQQNTWLLAPQRLISGMSVLGEWETRLVSILEHAHEHDLTLYFDDFLGLYSAGQSRDSDLNVANVLKPYVERREVRVLAEMTPSAFAVLQEQDRGLADQFQVVRLQESGEDETRRILLFAVRVAERQHRCRFSFDAMSTLLDLQRRYVRHSHFPGKAVVFLRRLAAKSRGQSIGRAAVLDEFHVTSGLALAILDQQKKLEPADVVTALSGAIIGQDNALRVVADTVSVAKARLQDVERPLASILFVGPTGVGKTQTARSLAAFLFGSDEKLVRFNMNEFVDPGAAARLVGTFHAPDGLLTAAVRRQPFCVLLLDEIEKAHGAVFNLLLQVMGDGRLTDALGRTVDFTQCIVIMTSNLGVREASHPLGLRSPQGSEAQSYVGAVREFFSAEFFNRLDHVVPFERLRREDARAIARLLLQRLLRREGVVRRKCVLSVATPALDRIVDLGFHPTLGARALKRSLEGGITHPLAARLAEVAPHDPIVISFEADDAALQVFVEALMPAAFQEPSRATAESLTAAVDGMERELERRKPEHAVTSDALDAVQLQYYAAHDQLRRVRGMMRSAERSPRPARSSGTRGGPRRDVEQRRGRPLRSAGPHQQWCDLLQAPGLHRKLSDVQAAAADVDPRAEARREIAWLGILLRPTADEVLLEVRALQVCDYVVRDLLEAFYVDLCRDIMEWEVEAVRTEAAVAGLRVRGSSASLLLSGESGTHLMTSPSGVLEPLQVQVRDAAPASGGLTADSAWKMLPVVRVYDGDAVTLDLRTGRLVAGLPNPAEMRAFLLEMLPSVVGEEVTA